MTQASTIAGRVPWAGLLGAFFIAIAGSEGKIGIDPFTEPRRYWICAGALVAALICGIIGMRQLARIERLISIAIVIVSALFLVLIVGSAEDYEPPSPA